jgi:hypothetical protein
LNFPPPKMYYVLSVHFFYVYTVTVHVASHFLAYPEPFFVADRDRRRLSYLSSHPAPPHGLTTDAMAMAFAASVSSAAALRVNAPARRSATRPLPPRASTRRARARVVDVASPGTVATTRRPPTAVSRRRPTDLDPVLPLSLLRFLHLLTAGPRPRAAARSRSAPGPSLRTTSRLASTSRWTTRRTRWSSSCTSSPGRAPRSCGPS